MANNWNKNKNGPYNPESELYRRLTKLLSGPIVNFQTQKPKYGRIDQFIDASKSTFKSASGQQFKKQTYDPFNNLQAMAVANASERMLFMIMDTPSVLSIGPCFALWQYLRLNRNASRAPEEFHKLWHARSYPTVPGKPQIRHWKAYLHTDEANPASIYEPYLIALWPHRESIPSVHRINFDPNEETATVTSTPVQPNQ